MGDRYVPIEEKDKGGGEGFLSFLTKLEWIKNAEVENTKPFMVETLRTNHYVYILKHGAKMGAFLHALAVGLMVLVMFGTWVVETFKFMGYAIELYLLGVKIGFPAWFVRRFVVYEHGLTTEITKVYLSGFSLVSFGFDALSAIATFLIALFANVFYGIGEGGIFSFYDNILYPIIMSFFNLHTLVVWLINMVCDLFGLFFFYLYRKKRRYTLPVWTPLDEIPIEEQE